MRSLRRYGQLQTTVTGNVFIFWLLPVFFRCGNVASVLVIRDSGQQEFKCFEAAPLNDRVGPSKRPIPEYFL